MIWNMTGQVCHKHWSCYAWEHLNQVWSASVVNQLFQQVSRKVRSKVKVTPWEVTLVFQCMCHILKLFNALERSDGETSDASVLSKSTCNVLYSHSFKSYFYPTDPSPVCGTGDISIAVSPKRLLCLCLPALFSTPLLCLHQPATKILQLYQLTTIRTCLYLPVTQLHTVSSQSLGCKPSQPDAQPPHSSNALIASPSRRVERQQLLCT